MFPSVTAAKGAVRERVGKIFKGGVVLATDNLKLTAREKSVAPVQGP